MDGRGWASRGAAAAALVLALAACTSPEPEHDRADEVVVAVGAPFLSLNAATAAGLAPGSTLVRGLVQSGFTTLEEDGTVVADPSFGTVEVVDDDPFTVRYTIAETATWSDGVPVTPADLLLEWAARSGQLDEVVPELDDQGLPADVEALDDVVAFAATSPVLVHATSVPRVDGATVTVVYDRPVADWELALDVNLPAHVVGRTALAPASAASASATPEPAASGSAAPAADDAQRWAGAVQDAVEDQDHDALVAVAAAWRSAGLAGDPADDPTLTTTTGPYVLASVDADGATLVPNTAFAGDAPAAYAQVRVRTDLDPLAQVDAVAAGDVDVAVPLSTADVLDAATRLEDGATVSTGGDAVLQLVLQEDGGGVFDPEAGEDAGAARAAFVAAVPREEVATRAVQPLWSDAPVSDDVLAQVALTSPAGASDASTEDPVAGPDARATAAGPAGDASAGPAAGATTTVVRVLVNTDDPVRAEAFAVLTEAAADAGLEVVRADVDDPAAALRDEPEAWDAALVPVQQEALPVQAVVARWRTGGPTNVSGHADADLDEALSAADRLVDVEERSEALAAVGRSLVDTRAVLPLVRTPALTVVRDGAVEGLPQVGDVPVLSTARADLTSWWGWVRG